MGTGNYGIDLRETSRLSERFTELSNLTNDWLKRGLISDSLVLTGRGYLEHDSNSVRSVLEVDKVVKGDFAYFGNQGGVVEYVYVNADSEAIEALVVYMNNEAKLPQSLSISGDGSRKLFLLSNTIEELELEEDHEDLEVVSLANEVLDLSSLVILRRQTEDINTWNSISQMMLRFGSMVDPTIPTSLYLSGELKDSDGDLVYLESGVASTVYADLGSLPMGSSLPVGTPTVSLVEAKTGVTVSWDGTLKKVKIVTTASVTDGDFSVKVELGTFEVTQDYTVLVP